MMSDKKNAHNSQDITPANKVTPQSAMDDYFEDMFGTAEDDPLKKLSLQQQSPELQLNSSSTEKAQNASSELRQRQDNRKALIPKPKLKPKKQVHNAALTSFVEPEKYAGTISPLIIPAAFPKLAPATPKIDLEIQQKQESVKKIKTEEKLEVKVALKSATEEKSVKVATKPVLDAKTALALLEKNRSKLSLAQRQKLDQKLKKLTSTKQVQSEEKVALNPVTRDVNAVQEPPITKVEIKVNEVVPSQSLDVKVAAAENVQKSKLPDWASRRFECLIFSVAGLKLAVPLMSLGAIYKIEKHFIPLVGRADWFMGLYHHLERNVRVIDTAQWVMPERCSDEVRTGYKFIIRLGGNDWGIACDAVHQSIQLYPDQVKWRTERTKRAWLFGTVIEHMCALIDADTLSSLLEQQASKNPRIFS